MWPAAGRSALAASRSPRAPTTSPPSVRPGRRMYSRPWPTPPPCSTPSSREPALGLAGGRARSQGAGRRSRWAARRAGARRGDARLSGRHDRPTVRSGPYAHEARSGAAAARVSTGRRQSGLRRVGVEGATLATREVPPPRRSGDARCGPRLRGDHPRAAGVCGVGAHRPSRGGVSARPGRATPRVVSGDGCAARGRRRAVRDRARDRGDGPRPGPLSSRVAAVFRGPVRSPYGSGRPPRAMSASVKIPMPLRVPELAPSLGRVLVPRRLEELWIPLDDIREELATRVIELGGEARAAAGREDRDRVLDAVSRRAWLGAWEAAVRRAGERVTAALGGEIERAARRVRMPRRLRRRRLLTGPEKRAIAARLRAGGRRFGPWSRCGRRSAWRWYGSDWCWAATCPPPHGSRRASASERRAVTAIGVGVDLVEVSRVAAIIADKGSRVFQRLLTPTERAYCESRPDPATHVAVRLAAKEAVYKALQGSEAARGIGWREIEVIRAPDGRPDVRLTGFAAARAEQLGVERVLLSLSHTHQAAVAVVVLERG